MRNSPFRVAVRLTTAVYNQYLALDIGSITVVSVLIEALLLAAAGGILGACLAWLFFNGRTVSTTQGSAYAQLIFDISVTLHLAAIGVGASSVIGFIGGLNQRLFVIWRIRAPVVSGPSRAPAFQAFTVAQTAQSSTTDKGSIMRSLIIGFGLFGIAAIILPAAADNGPLYVAPGPSNLIAPDVVRRNQEQLAGTARRLGDLIGDSLRSRTSHATDLLVTTKCGHYLSASITFADGSAKTLNLGNAPATTSDMEKAKAAIPILRIVDQPGCDP